ncbi:hypothetical protein BDZ89DRAFT_1040880 [Hymenopellis radicata]|nr:hypothetical protein BDZ89DRAFT_1040880 [Hymenopellis radicata]
MFREFEQSDKALRMETSPPNTLEDIDGMLRNYDRLLEQTPLTFEEYRQGGYSYQGRRNEASSRPYTTPDEAQWRVSGINLKPDGKTQYMVQFTDCPDALPMHDDELVKLLCDS